MRPVTESGTVPATGNGPSPVLPPPGFGPLWPVSVKGVVQRAGAVVLLRNERDEWELPGGRLEPGESPEECVVRELAEETGWLIRCAALLDVWVYQPFPNRQAERRVLIVTFGCATDSTLAPVVSDEHREVGLFTPAQVDGLRMPDGYKRSVRAWAGHPANPEVGGAGARA